MDTNVRLTSALKSKGEQIISIIALDLRVLIIKRPGRTEPLVTAMPVRQKVVRVATDGEPAVVKNSFRPASPQEIEEVKALIPWGFVDILFERLAEMDGDGTLLESEVRDIARAHPEFGVG